ncbi:uncharacterized protein C8Q71DRAFT_517105 [Rhodofomes roseus]|uniref:Uncharacterized protein n=1 Tax=Rhodofomes roseus TaxID=34475 RepID=A0ABQ8KMI5_9APHY|nr:uncharacterized protein C8Q71DRAFT_517105 [Rhodofomes roseus]KAH9839539.1 hypothetical protein C8Q71DRAFT_517105 [Rhodofomes roseus]
MLDVMFGSISCLRLSTECRPTLCGCAAATVVWVRELTTLTRCRWEYWLVELSWSPPPTASARTLGSQRCDRAARRDRHLFSGSCDVQVARTRGPCTRLCTSVTHLLLPAVPHRHSVHNTFSKDKITQVSGALRLVRDGGDTEESRHTVVAAVAMRTSNVSSRTADNNRYLWVSWPARASCTYSRLCFAPPDSRALPVVHGGGQRWLLWRGSPAPRPETYLRASAKRLSI